MPFSSTIGTGSLQFHSPMTATSLANPLNAKVVIVGDSWDDASTSFDVSGLKTTTTNMKTKKRAGAFIHSSPGTSSIFLNNEFAVSTKSSMCLQRKDCTNSLAGW